MPNFSYSDGYRNTSCYCNNLSNYHTFKCDVIYKKVVTVCIYVLGQIRMVVLYYVSLASCNQIRNSVNLCRKTKRVFLSFDHHEKGQNNRVTQISFSYDLPFLNGDTDLLLDRVATSEI